MNHKQHFSDEIINAFIDGELEAKEQSRIREAMEEDDLLRRRVNDLTQVSELVKAAFDDIAPTPRQTGTRRQGSGGSSRLYRLAAALAVVGLGSLFGWHIYEHRDPYPLTAANLIIPGGNIAHAAPSEQSVKVLFHVGRDDPQLLDRILDQTQAMLSVEQSPDLSIRIVASHGGLSLFRIDNGEYSDRVQLMQAKFQSKVAFVGCGETYAQWQNQELKKRHEQTKPPLVPEMVMVDSGVRELLRRQKQGWTYIQI